MPATVRWICIAIVLLCVQSARAADDPLNSPVWSAIAEKSFGLTPIVFDDRVKVTVPMIVENQGQVPITADARGLSGVTQLMIIADLNPIQRVLLLSTIKSEPYISIRLKIEQATPIRAAALASDGVWHVGSVYLDAAGGGCSAPGAGRADADWSATLGRSQGRIWREPDGTSRLRLRVRHPMDTGLAKDGTPAFFIEHVAMTDAAGAGLATLEFFEPVSEDPTVTLLLHPSTNDGAVTVHARDNNGGIFQSSIPAPKMTSAHDGAGH